MRIFADRPWLRAGLSVAVTGALLLWVGFTVDLGAVWGELGRLRVGYLLVAALAIGPLQVLLAAERWRAVSGCLHQPIPRGRAVREVALSMLLNQLLPGGVTGDALRAWRASHGGLVGSIRAVVTDRVVGFGVHVAVVAAGLAVWPWVLPVPVPPAAVGVCGALLAMLVGVALAPSAVPGLGRLGADLRALARGPGGASALGLSLVMTGAFLTGFGWCGDALGIPLGWVAWTAVPLVFLSMAVPLGFGGFGLREATAAVLLPRLGIPAEQAVAISAVYGLAATLGALPGALVPLWR